VAYLAWEAAKGALIGGGIDLALQLATNGGNLSCVDWGRVGHAAAVGAIGGAAFGALGKAFQWLRGVRSTPDFIAPSRGPAVKVPEGYTARVADNGKGMVLQHPNAAGNSGAVRIMDATPRYPNGYFRYYNEYGQPINPATGLPGPNSATHVPMNYEGPLLNFPQ
jgi:hypothetical protein